ncbi:MAG: L-histidine N(alpha)-methyltransferase [Verrucomicrobiota bacterium]
MPSSVQVAFHPSQLPENVRRDLLTSLRTRRVNHKFHYDSIKQTQKWLALHEAHSPARRDKNCLATYDQAFVQAAKQIKARQIHVIGLGCGGGQKDAQLLGRLQSRGKKTSYAPGDVSVAMVLVARAAALKYLQPEKCFPFVCDLATADNLPEMLAQDRPLHGTSLITFFGMIPNFEPRQILPKLATLLRPGDYLLFGANLAPGKDCDAGMKKILPQYDNPQTHDWLSTFLFDLGVERCDGQLRFNIETGGLGLQRVVARFHFCNARRIKVGNREFSFAPGEAIRLFFSYRYTPALVCKLLGQHGLDVSGGWTTESEEEGVFLCRRK